MRYSVCVSAVYSGLSIEEALPHVKKLGFPAYEFWGWWDQDVDAIAKKSRELGLETAAVCTRFISLCDPACRGAYIEGLRESVAAAKKLGCSVLISQVGQELPGAARRDQHASIAAGLKACAPMLEEAGVTLVIEPLNTRVDHKGYYLSGSDEAFEILDEVGSPAVKVLFDVYHQQITEGDIVSRIRANADKIGHIHIAGNPGRHEPFENSELFYPEVIRALKEAGYDQSVGLEYMPLRDPDESLKLLLEKMPL